MKIFISADIEGTAGILTGARRSAATPTMPSSAR